MKFGRNQSRPLNFRRIEFFIFVLEEILIRLAETSTRFAEIQTDLTIQRKIRIQAEGHGNFLEEVATGSSSITDLIQRLILIDALHTKKAIRKSSETTKRRTIKTFHFQCT